MDNITRPSPESPVSEIRRHLRAAIKLLKEEAERNPEQSVDFALMALTIDDILTDLG